MDTTALFVTTGGVAAICFTLWFFFGKRGEVNSPKNEPSNPYVCPIHPWITSSDPTASCSICSMKLVRESREQK